MDILNTYLYQTRTRGVLQIILSLVKTVIARAAPEITRFLSLLFSVLVSRLNLVPRYLWSSQATRAWVPIFVCL
jgi:hypothetical protein